MRREVGDPLAGQSKAGKCRHAALNTSGAPGSRQACYLLTPNDRSPGGSNPRPCRGIRASGECRRFRRGRAHPRRRRRSRPGHVLALGGQALSGAPPGRGRRGGTVRTGTDMLALACASHSSEPRHLEVTDRMLAAIGCTEADLACGPHPPLGPRVAKRGGARGVHLTPRWSNCSGKHAGMLALARHRNWPTQGYEVAGHPVQDRLLTAISRVDRPGNQRPGARRRRLHRGLSWAAGVRDGPGVCEPGRGSDGGAGHGARRDAGASGPDRG